MNFEPVNFWCILFFLSILVLISVNLIDTMQSANIAGNVLTFVFETFTRYSNNKTNVWQEILTLATSPFSCEVVHEKIKTIRVYL